MNKYKVCVYGVCKNEEKFAKRCMDSIKDADIIIMGDTGSVDNTVGVLRECGASVYSIPVIPWRFDVARNELLKFIPEDVDICISIDLDEVIEPGWREALEEAWEQGTHRANYHYIWSFNKDGSPAVEFYQERIHARHNYRWIFPTHEVLEYLGEEPEKWCHAKGFIVKHYPDQTKSRSFNLELLELAVQESPDSTRNMHYLGREYYFMHQWEKCIETLKKYLDMPGANWEEERSFAMRYISEGYSALGDELEAKSWLLKAIAEAPYRREAYVQMCRLAYNQGDWKLICLMSKWTLQIRDKVGIQYNEAFAWDETIYDLTALAYHFLGKNKEALFFAREAIQRAPDDERLQNNLRIIEETLKSQV